MNLSVKKIKEYAGGALVLAASVAIAILVPEGWILPLCGPVVVLGGSSIYGIRAYRQRLEIAIQNLKSLESEDQIVIPGSLLIPIEQKLLRLDAPRPSSAHIAMLRERQMILLYLGMHIIIPVIVAFITLLIVFSD